MTRTQRPISNPSLYGQIDAMPMPGHDRELAKARLRAMEGLTDAICAMFTAIRSLAAGLQSMRRSALRNSPARP